MSLNLMLRLACLGAPGTWQKHYVWMETITRSAQHLMGIINDIITVRAARSGMHLKQELVGSWLQGYREQAWEQTESVFVCLNLGTAAVKQGHSTVRVCMTRSRVLKVSAAP